MSALSRHSFLSYQTVRFAVSLLVYVFIGGLLALASKLLTLILFGLHLLLIPIACMPKSRKWNGIPVWFALPLFLYVASVFCPFDVQFERKGEIGIDIRRDPFFDDAPPGQKNRQLHHRPQMGVQSRWFVVFTLP